MKPFDLEAAKAGKPFGRENQYEYRFVGVRADGRIAFEYKLPDEAHDAWVMSSCAPEFLTMLPEKKIFKGLLYRTHYKSIGCCGDTADNRKFIRGHNLMLIKEFEVEYTDE